MNLSTLLTRPVTVTTPGEGDVDEYGNPTPTAGTSVTVNGYVEQKTTREITDGQQTAQGDWWAALPTGTAVAATSTLTIVDSGQTFQVAGEPETKWNPWTQTVEFIRVELETETA